MKIKRIAVLLLCLSLMLSACGKTETPVEPQESEAPVVEDNKPDWQVGFEYVLSVSDSSDEYTLFDLDRDGEPEMITRVGGGDDVEFYTYDWSGNGSVIKAYVFGGYADLVSVSKEGSVLFRQNGPVEKVYRLRYSDGAGSAEQIISRTLAEGEQPLAFDVMPMYRISDLSGLDWNGDPADNNDKVLDSYEEVTEQYVEGPGDKPTYEGEIINWIGAYNKAISEFGSYTAQDTAKYCIYDLDNDDVPEMLVIFGGYVTDLGIWVIDAKFGDIVTKTQVLDGTANVAGLSSENAVLLHRIHMGTEYVYKVVYVGAQYKAVQVIDSRPLDSATDALKFSYLSMHDFSDTDGIYWPGNKADKNNEVLANAK